MIALDGWKPEGFLVRTLGMTEGEAGVLQSLFTACIKLNKIMSMKEPPPNSIHPLTRREWREWLQEHHAQTKGIWLLSYSRASGKPRFEYEEAVEEALCFGWIDARLNKLDGERSMLWFTPRKPGSVWSPSNKLRVEKLSAAGLVAPAGLAKVEAAKQDGSWNALDDIEALVIPDDLAQALAENPPAARYFDAFPASVKKMTLFWIASAKRPQTRRQRIEETVRLAAQNLRITQRQV
jgi:uncharacterized protein YdeI (YjbR/CyaY-like superfamily)